MKTVIRSQELGVKTSQSAGLAVAKRCEHGFTMIEIALSLAVIGFALVAIIGVLPTGMDVQKQNRQETIINQDMSIWIDALRNGQRGLDDLTNYVLGVYNTRITYAYRPPQKLPQVTQSNFFYYTATNSNSPEILLTNGFNIIGLLSTPKYVAFTNGNTHGFYSNYCVAYVRSMSGPAAEKYPQTNSEVQLNSLEYRMVPELTPFASYDMDWTNYAAYSAVTNQMLWRSNYFVTARTLQADLNDVRLLFRWPVFPGGVIGNGRQIFRTMAGGSVTATNMTFPARPETTLYFLEPRTYVRAQ
jgi:type II secretory pathway pseudopilin PulG